MTRKEDKAETSKLRAHHNWTSRYDVGKFSKFLNKCGIGSTDITFSCGGTNHIVKLKGCLVSKANVGGTESKARLMRKRGNQFFFLADLSEVGVNKSARKRGGYYLYSIIEIAGEFVVKRKYYSLDSVSHLRLDGMQFHNVFWRVFNDRYCGVTIEESVGGDNSS